MEEFIWFSVAAFTVYGIKELSSNYGDKSAGIVLVVLAIAITAIELTSR